MFATPEPGEEEDDQPIAPVDRTSHEAWALEQQRLLEAGLREPRDPKYDLIPLQPLHLTSLANGYRREHIFDGQVLHRDKPDYQLCDIEDPLIKRYIDDPRLITDKCDVSLRLPPCVLAV
jgi:general transcription factor 3C polypeptide 5 (transcription factor C subunit 1)